MEDAADQERSAVSRAGAEWCNLRADTDWEVVCRQVGLALPFIPGAGDINPDAPDMAAVLALADLGICHTRIMKEPRFKVRPEKAERDANLERNTMHLAPLWRYPVSEASLGFQAEKGAPALILPVASGERYNEVVSLARTGDERLATEIVDLVALPLDGGRPLSMTGYTVAIGPMRADQGGRLVVFGGGRAWLDAYLSLVRKIAADTPAHLVEQLHMPFPVPEPTLLVEPQALEWRVTQWRCVIPTDAKQIVCPDSRALAQQIDAAMRKKERVRPLPTVCGPKGERAA